MNDIVETRLNNAIKKNQIDDKKVKVLLEFDRYNKANGLTENTRFTQIQSLVKFSSTVKKDFKKLTKKDIELFFSEKKGSKYSIEITKIIIKKFMKWLYGGDDFPACVKGITYARNAYKFKRPEEMLTEKEIKKLIDVCDNLRDRTIVSLLYDTAIRVGELVNLNVGNVTNDGEHLSITVSGKTGQRTIGLISSGPLINEYLNLHMYKNNLDAPLFISHNGKNYGGRLTENSVLEFLYIYRERAGICKKVTCHMLRHSKLTELARKGMNESQMRIFAGWSRNSNMPSVYLHLTSEDVNNKRLELETGIKPKQKEIEKSSFLPVFCPRCGKQNDSANNYCSSCWLPLTREDIDRDIKIITTFKSKFARAAINVDQFISDYYNFKTTTEEYLEFYKAFDGKNSIPIELLRQKLNWTKGRFEQFIDGLLETGVLKINNGTLTIETFESDGVQKSVFDNFLMFQKML